MDTKREPLASQAARRMMFGTKSAVALAVLLSAGWAYYLLFEDAVVLAKISTLVRDLPWILALPLRGLAIVAVVAIPVSAAFTVLLRLGVWIDFRLTVRRMDTERRNRLDSEMVRLEKEGKMSPEEIEDPKKSIEDAEGGRAVQRPGKS